MIKIILIRGTMHFFLNNPLKYDSIKTDFKIDF